MSWCASSTYTHRKFHHKIEMMFQRTGVSKIMNVFFCLGHMNIHNWDLLNFKMIFSVCKVERAFLYKLLLVYKKIICSSEVKCERQMIFFFCNL